MDTLQLFEDRFSDPTANAQHNLMGRTHYADPETLRFHKARILQCHVTDGGLLLALVESVSLDWDNTRRGFRYAFFDITGECFERPALDGCYSTRKAAVSAMWAALNKINAIEVTEAAVKRWIDRANESGNEMLAMLQTRKQKAA